MKQQIRMALFGLILLVGALSFTSCAKGKGTTQEALYGELQAAQGKVYPVLISEYIGIAPLYCGCDSRYQTVGHEELTTQGMVTTCPTEVRTYVYEGLVPVEKAGETYYLPIQVRSYEIIQLSDYPADTIGGQEYSRVLVEARRDISTVASYRGTGDFVFSVPHNYESDTEMRTHLPDETISQPGNNDRP